MTDHALLSDQLEGIDEFVNDLAIVPLPGVGHFAPWEAPVPVTEAIRSWLSADLVTTCSHATE
jgi:pimeloyl-ACP methyl ester carboxylesterase